MKVFIQCERTKRFMGKGMRWVKRKLFALPFKTSANALEYCLKNQITGVAIVLEVGDKSQEVRLRGP